MRLPETFIKNSENINVIIETPKGSGTKFTFDPEIELFTLSKILPQGLVFPLHFGFIPNTKGEDGDPLDVLVLMDEPSYPGCLIECKVLGAIEAEQTERDGKTVRNDRLIGAAVESYRYNHFKNITDLDEYLIKEITSFFINYNELSNKIFKPLQNSNASDTIKLIKKQMTNE